MVDFPTLSSPIKRMRTVSRRGMMAEESERATGEWRGNPTVVCSESQPGEGGGGGGSER